jgi:FAD/FMN-containing dehydrogenase/Fe-S oxidoreductase
LDPATLRQRLRDDLRREFRGELRVDTVSRALYATDASLFQVEPLAVAIPRDEDDLRVLVRYAHERSIPLIPRGAGTGLAGESLGAGIVIDLSVHFRLILKSGSDWVRVQAGTVLDRLNAELAKSGRRFAPDPASGASCTIGGMIATDASGGRAAVHGYTRDHVRALRVVWDDGSAGCLSAGGSAIEPGTRAADLYAGVRALLETHAEAIAATRPRTPFNRSGYRLYDVGTANRVDLVRLLVGSEGTLALTTEATLRTIPLSGGRAGVLFGFDSFEAALDAGLAARELRPATCEVLDRRLLTLARSEPIRSATALPPETEALLLVDFERDTPGLASEAVAALLGRITQACVAVSALGADEVEGLLTYRAAALPALYAVANGPRPIAIVEDMGVEPDQIPDFVAAAKAIVKSQHFGASFLIHVATGQVHLRPILDPADPADVIRLWPLADELHGLAIDMGGTISAQHGTGLARTPWVERQYGPLLPAFRELKRLFDPRGILNPGKIVGPDPSRPAWPLRTFPASPAVPDGVQPAVDGGSPKSSARPARLLQWAETELADAVAGCNGCGACRTTVPAARMCPTFRALATEAAAPRAKANLFRAVLDSAPLSAGDDAVRAVADLCVNCKMCALECPGKVDIPKLMLEAKAANHAEHGLRRSAWFLARMEGLIALGSRLAPVSNLLLGRSVVRWGLEKVFGLARTRTLPAFAFRSFLRRARRQGLTRRPADGAAVAYFVDTFASAFDPSVAEATIRVLQHNGVPVYVPARQCGSGALAIAQGDTDVARERLAHNIRRLADAARAGDAIVCTEPTAALFFRLDALGLSADPDVKLVADRTVELTSYLWGLHESGRLRTDFQPLPVTVGHHIPCHVKALKDGIHAPALLALIPELRVTTIDVSCSGMAGTYGLNARNLPTSLAAGRPMLDEFARPRHLYGSSECSACRLQMQQGTGKRALHPVQYLALAYGLMPSLTDHLRKPFAGRVCG